MNVLATFWDGAELRIRTDEGDVPWQETIDWTVGEDVAPETLDQPECLFEPRCLRFSEPCNCTFGARPHVVYAAFYGVLAKVGLTSSNRLATRLREQGADAGFIVKHLPDRGAARALEKQISFQHRIPEWRTRREKWPLWTRPVQWDRIEQRAADLRERLAELGTCEELQLVQDVPMDPLPARPAPIAAAGTHKGSVLGAKGQYIFYRPTGAANRLKVGDAPVLALKHTALVGRTLD